MDTPERRPWLVAAWPGMGAVAHLAASYLVETLEAPVLEDLPSEGFFDVASVAVRDGLVQPAHLPRGRFHRWRDPDPDGRDLVVFLGEQQPTQHGWAYCKALLDVAERLGVERVVTFAALARPMHPTSEPSVFAATTRRPLLEEAREFGIAPLESGEVGGLNGVLLAAAASRELDGLCLLGELPFFASQVPNPRASRALVRVFAGLSGADVDTSALDEQVERMDDKLQDAFEAIQAAGRALVERTDEEGEAEFPDDGDDEASEDAGAAPAAEPPPEPEVRLTPAETRRVETLFEAAAADRAQAVALKAELDRLGVFKRYEDRFLDLFRRAD